LKGAMSMQENKRILIVDDTPSIHEDFTKILVATNDDDIELQQMFADFFDDNSADSQPPTAVAARAICFELQHAYQGEEALQMVQTAEAEGNPYAVAFVDVRMPPGWDGIETINRIWSEFPHVEMVICTAYSDYSWENILEKLGVTDQLQFLRKPFDVISVRQMALALTKKWNLGAQARCYVQELEHEVAQRTSQLVHKIEELEKALTEIKQLRGILPMCVYCNKIRDDANYWQKVDSYIRSHTLAEISHGICPSCFAEHVEPMLAENDIKLDDSEMPD